jgi:hypothetical protein
LEVQNQLCREAWKNEALAYNEMKVAHANGLPTKYPIPTTPSREIVGQCTKWHSTVRVAANHILDWSIREYKKYPRVWKSALQAIQEELDEQFSFVYPVRPEYLAEYVLDFIANDRYQWKKFWLETAGKQHELCPDKAYAVLDKYWRSEEGRSVSEKMKERDSHVGKRSRSLGATVGGRSASDVEFLVRPNPVLTRR